MPFAYHIPWSPARTGFDLHRLSLDIAAMRIAFYAPLKSPDHPVVSGDREMARLLICALELAGHTVEVASELRAYLREPDSDAWETLRAAATAEVERLARHWAGNGPPDLWFTYHPYYKSPDLIGPPLASRFSLPFVTAEASLSSRRNIGAWAQAQATVVDAVSQAAVNLCLTRRDRDGLAGLAPEARLAMLPPFIDTAGRQRPPSVLPDISPSRGEIAGGNDSDLPATPAIGEPTDAGRSLPLWGRCPAGQRGVAADPGTRIQLATVAMMRPGDKLDSYRMLADALALIEHHPWQLTVAGDGPAEAEVKALFQQFPQDRINFLGRLDREDVAGLLANSDLYVWPGCGEAFGLAYLEAQAAGLPVVAQETAGVPEVVQHGETGLLTPAGYVRAYAEAIARLIGDAPERRRLGDNARRHVAEKHSLAAAARRLTQLLPTPPVA